MKCPLTSRYMAAPQLPLEDTTVHGGVWVLLPRCDRRSGFNKPRWIGMVGLRPWLANSQTEWNKYYLFAILAILLYSILRTDTVCGEQHCLNHWRDRGRCRSQHWRHGILGKAEARTQTCTHQPDFFRLVACIHIVFWSTINPEYSIRGVICYMYKSDLQANLNV